jgi:hypothetical protein
MRARRAAERAKRERLVESVADVEPVEPVAEGGDTGSGTGSTADATDGNVAPVATDRSSPKHVKLCERLVADSVRGLADSYVLLAVHPDCPSIGDDRAELLGQVWGKYLAPYIDPNNPEWVGMTMATIATVGVGVSFSREVSLWKKAHPDKVKPAK